MKVTVKLNYLRIAPRKVRLVADLIRKKKVVEAEQILRFTRKKAALPVQKLLKSAISTAKNDFQLEESNLFISEIKVDEGPTLKRYRPRAYGRIYPIMKRTSHIILVLDEIEPTKKKIKKPKREIKKPEIEEPRKEKKETIEKEEFEKREERKITIPRPRFDKTIKRIFRRKAF